MDNVQPSLHISGRRLEDIIAKVDHQMKKLYELKDRLISCSSKLLPGKSPFVPTIIFGVLPTIGKFPFLETY